MRFFRAKEVAQRLMGHVRERLLMPNPADEVSVGGVRHGGGAGFYRRPHPTPTTPVIFDPVTLS
jgi:hypothetical protein